MSYPPKTSFFAACVVGLTLVCLLAGVPVAAAQGRDPAAAEALFREGRRLLAAKDHASARAKFAESFRLDPTAGTLMNLAVCEEALGLLASAWQSWRAALDYLRPSEKQRRAVAAERVAALQPLVPKLTITLGPSAGAETEVRRNGVRLGPASFDVALPVDPGSHEILVSQPGRQDARYEVTLAPGQSRTARVEAGPERRPEVVPEKPAAPVAAASPPSAAPPLTIDTSPGATPHDRGGSAWGSTLLVAGVVVAGAGGVSAYLAHRARQDAADDCRTQMGARFCLASANGAIDRDRRYSLLADVGFGLGAVLVGTGVLMLAGGGDEDQAAAAIEPMPGGVRLAVSGRF